jgi:hypothetical protein
MAKALAGLFEAACGAKRQYDVQLQYNEYEEKLPSMMEGLAQAINIRVIR